MSSFKNTALWVDEECHCHVLRQDTKHVLAPGEVLVENLYSGLNPADLKHALFLGIRPAAMGYDFCGRVVEVTSNSRFNIGDVIAGYTPTGLGRPSKYGTHQSYLACPERMAFLVPEHLPQAHAACLSTVVKTAADALFNLFKFRLPSEGKIENVGPLIIWGASSSVGVCTVQFARAIGASPIIVTASAKRHSELLALGATHCFDYASPTAIPDIRDTIARIGCGHVLHAIDAVGSMEEPSSVDLLAQCCPAEANIVSVVHRVNPRYRMPFADKDNDVKIQLPTGHVQSFHPQPEDARRMSDALAWAVDNYGREGGFRMPHVRVVEGSAEQALEEVRRVANHGAGFEKVVLAHPLS